MKLNIGSVFITQESDSIASVTAADAFWGIAESLMPGVHILVNAPGAPAVPITFLCCHILECLLKAFLSKVGISANDLRNQKKFGHDLSELWQEAVTRGLPIPSVLPQWVKHLSILHSSPYPLRYPMDVSGFVLPNPQNLLAELTDLLETVRQKMR